MKLTTTYHTGLLQEHTLSTKAHPHTRPSSCNQSPLVLLDVETIVQMGRSSFSQLMKSGKERREGRGESACLDPPKERHGEEGQGRGARSITSDQMQSCSLKNKGWWGDCVCLGVNEV